MPDDPSDPDFLFCSNTAGCSIVGSQPKQEINKYINNELIDYLINTTEDRSASNDKLFSRLPRSSLSCSGGRGRGDTGNKVVLKKVEKKHFSLRLLR